MRLNPDCVRDILLKVEEVTNGQENVRFGATARQFHGLAEKYDLVDLMYHANQCNMNKYLDGFLATKRHFQVKGLTPKGHNFIENIRQESNWNEVKSVAEKAATFALDALEKIATGVATASINKLLGQ